MSVFFVMLVGMFLIALAVGGVVAFVVTLANPQNRAAFGKYLAIVVGAGLGIVLLLLMMFIGVRVAGPALATFEEPVATAVPREAQDLPLPPPPMPAVPAAPVSVASAPLTTPVSEPTPVRMVAWGWFLLLAALMIAASVFWGIRSAARNDAFRPVMGGLAFVLSLGGLVAGLYFLRSEAAAPATVIVDETHQVATAVLPAPDIAPTGAPADAEIPVPVESDDTPPPTSGSLTEPVAIISFAGESAAGTRVAQRPSWVSAPPTSTAGRESFVLTSQRFASIEEAEESLLAELRPRLSERIRSSGTDLDTAQITLDLVRQSGLRVARLQEEFLLQVGAHTEPVYRATWQVSLDDTTIRALVQPYLAARRKDRLWQAGSVFAGATLLFAAAAAGMYYDDRTQGRHRRRVVIAAGTLAAGLAGALAVIA